MDLQKMKEVILENMVESDFGDFLIDGKFYSPKFGCYTITMILSGIEALAELEKPTEDAEELAARIWATVGNHGSKKAVVLIQKFVDLEKKKEKNKLIELCDEYFVGYWEQEYAGARQTCVYCGTTMMENGNGEHHSASCPIIRYREIKEP